MFNLSPIPGDKVLAMSTPKKNFILSIKKWIFPLPILSLLFGSIYTNAGKLEPTSGECLFFRNGQLEKRQSCTYSGYSWAGGGFTELKWKDGVSTVIHFGIRGRGERPCPEVGVDGVCGEWHYRDATTFAPLPNAEPRQTQRNGIPTLQCVDVNNNSVCWRAVRDRIFQSMTQDIKNQLPRGMVMRLPASLEWMGSNGKIPIYPEILPQRSDGLVIVLNTQSNCQARLCQLGAISTFRNYLVQSQNIINRSGDPQYRETTPISLPQGIQGIYLKSWTGGASSVPGAAVLWEQDSQGFMISLPFSPVWTEEQNKQRIIDLAISMVNEPPI